jgi:hypothetical protein
VTFFFSIPYGYTALVLSPSRLLPSFGLSLSQTWFFIFLLHLQPNTFASLLPVFFFMIFLHFITTHLTVWRPFWNITEFIGFRIFAQIIFHINFNYLRQNLHMKTPTVNCPISCCLLILPLIFSTWHKPNWDKGNNFCFSFSKN